MLEFFVALIQHDPEKAVRIIALVIGFIGAHGIWQVIRRSNKDADVIRKALEREQARADSERAQADDLQDDVLSQTNLRQELLERLARAEAQREAAEAERERCRETLSRSGMGTLNAVEEQTLRDMVTRLKQENERLKKTKGTGREQ